MGIAQLIRNIWKYLTLAAVLVVIGIGALIGDSLYSTSLTSRLETPTLVQANPSGTQPLILPGQFSSCDFSLIFTSFPPKCKTSDGSFIQANGTSPFAIMIPGTK